MRLDAGLAKRLCEGTHRLVGILTIEEVHLFKRAPIGLHAREAAHLDDDGRNALKLVLAGLKLAGGLKHVAIYETELNLSFRHSYIYYMSVRLSFEILPQRARALAKANGKARQDTTGRQHLPPPFSCDGANIHIISNSLSIFSYLCPSMNDLHYPSKLLEKAVGEMAKLPGVGQKTALRLMLHLLRQKTGAMHALGESIIKLKEGVKYCTVCHNISDDDICEICRDERRDKSTICVVENVQNVMAIENTRQYHGRYHVLGGVISPMDGIAPADLEIASLAERVEAGGISEVILALNPNMEGDTTNFYISRRLQNTGVKMTTLARGISIGDDLEYTDEITLGRSIADRVELSSTTHRRS